MLLWTRSAAAFAAVGILLVSVHAVGGHAQDVQDALADGKSHYRHGDFEGAAVLFQHVVDTNPGEADHHAYLANAMYKSGNLEDAVESFARAIEMQPLRSRYHSNLGAILLEQEKFDDAVEQFTIAKGMEPEDGTLGENLQAALTFQRADLMEKEMRTGKGDYWDFRALFTGANYSDKAEVSFRYVTETVPELVPVALQVLRESVSEEPRFAIARHVLANTVKHYYDEYLEEFDENERREAVEEVTELLHETLGLDPKAAFEMIGPKTCDPAAEPITESPLRVVTVATAMRGELKNLQASASELGMTLDVLGMGKEWQGLGQKIVWFLEYLQNVPEGDTVLFIDAYDVLLLSPMVDILQRFRSFCAPIVMSAELACSPDKGLDFVYPKSAETPFTYLNSGSYIGRVADIIEMLHNVLDDMRRHHTINGASAKRLDDQRWFNRHYLMHQDTVALDTSGFMFHTLHDIDPALLKVVPGVPGTLWSEFTMSQPCLIHGNGNGLEALHHISNRLAVSGWPPNAEIVQPSTSLVSGLSKAGRMK